MVQPHVALRDLYNVTVPQARNPEPGTRNSNPTQIVLIKYLQGYLAHKKQPPP